MPNLVLLPNLNAFLRSETTPKNRDSQKSLKGFTLKAAQLKVLKCICETMTFNTDLVVYGLDNEPVFLVLRV